MTLDEQILASSPVDVENAAPASITDMSESGHADTETGCASEVTDVQKASARKERKRHLESARLALSFHAARWQLHCRSSLVVSTLRVHRLAKNEGWLVRCWKIISTTATWSAAWTLICRLFNVSFPVFLFPEKGCCRPGRGKNTGLRVAAVLGGVKVRGKILAGHERYAVVLSRFAVLAQILLVDLELCFAAAVKAACGHNVLLVCSSAAAFVRDFPGFLEVACLFGGASVVVGIGFFPIGTGFGGVTVGLFLTVDGIGILRVTVSVPLLLGWHCRVRLFRCSCRVSRVQRCSATVGGGPGVSGC